MATVYRFRAVLSGFIGGPGQNTWHVCQAGELGGATESDLEAIAGDIRAVYVAAAAYLAPNVKVDIFPVVEGYEISTGALTQVTGIATPATVASAGSGTESRATQFTMRLKTDAIRGSRVLQGRHFIGPAGGAWGGDDGQVASSVRTTLEAAYDGILDIAGNGRLVVWGQPVKDENDAVIKTGVIGYVQQVICNPTPGTLRSRKA